MGTIALSGCANRAYSDLYVENMAAEIRDLEDQLYEYDHEYRLLEQELASLRNENAILRPQAEAGSQSNKPLLQRNNSGTTPEFTPGAGPAAQPKAELPEEITLTPPSILQPSTEEADPPSSPFPGNELPAPNRDQSPSVPGDDGIDGDIDQLMPPTIELGEPMPPPFPVLKETVDGRSLAPANQLELNLSRIEVPAQLASQRKSVNEAANTPLASVTPAVEQVTDTRVVELAFHPSLSRTANFDDQTDDDGLILVLQPLNVGGQMVPVAAELAVVVLDPSREGNAARIGRWDYSAEEVKAKMQSIGSSQGIHLTLPWNGPDPGADRVIVFAKYTFPDQRQVIGEKTFFIAADNGLKTVWAPRGSSGDRVSGGTSSIAATHAGDSSISQANYSDSPNLPRVVRPASGTTPADPAPAPQILPPY